MSEHMNFVFFREKNRILEKKIGFSKTKKSGFRFPRNVSSENYFLKKIVQGHGAIVSSIPAGLFRVHETERMAEMDSAF